MVLFAVLLLGCAAVFLSPVPSSVGGPWRLRACARDPGRAVWRAVMDRLHLHGVLRGVRPLPRAKKINENEKYIPTCRIRTSDLRIYLQRLQSSALPTELRSVSVRIFHVVLFDGILCLLYEVNTMLCFARFQAISVHQTANKHALLATTNVPVEQARSCPKPRKDASRPGALRRTPAGWTPPCIPLFCSTRGPRQRS